jgi:hypothetical protein
MALFKPLNQNVLNSFKQKANDLIEWINTKQPHSSTIHSRTRIDQLFSKMENLRTIDMLTIAADIFLGTVAKCKNHEYVSFLLTFTKPFPTFLSFSNYYVYRQFCSIGLFHACSSNFIIPYYVVTEEILNAFKRKDFNVVLDIIKFTNTSGSIYGSKLADVDYETAMQRYYVVREYLRSTYPQIIHKNLVVVFDDDDYQLMSDANVNKFIKFAVFLLTHTDYIYIDIEDYLKGQVPYELKRVGPDDCSYLHDYLSGHILLQEIIDDENSKFIMQSPLCRWKQFHEYDECDRNIKDDMGVVFRGEKMDVKMLIYKEYHGYLWDNLRIHIFEGCTQEQIVDFIAYLIMHDEPILANHILRPPIDSMERKYYAIRTKAVMEAIIFKILYDSDIDQIAKLEIVISNLIAWQRDDKRHRDLLIFIIVTMPYSTQLSYLAISKYSLCYLS